MAIELLSVAPQSGVLTPYADLVLVELFLTVASIIVFGATLDQANRQDACGASCVYPIVAVVFFAVVVGALAVRHAVMALSPSGRLQSGRPGMRISPGCGRLGRSGSSSPPSSCGGPPPSRCCRRSPRRRGGGSIPTGGWRPSRRPAGVAWCLGGSCLSAASAASTARGG
eukprot:TRINITY_DN3970_c0_g1_i3.p1 TRINITY_DN3970_c0_g1~~TRINITY_DN3970_c0_g1_i3.p1  ORF type:complete len:170 (-),score=32.97 TRINITY_DN3970_c0_g1_i3:157-666(-)